MYGINKSLQLHFIGIGGIGMSGIAEVLINLGYKVSGSDLSRSPVIERLERLGAEIFQGHKEENVKHADIVIYSSAVTDKNPEYTAAKLKNIPIIRRAEMLAELMRLKFGIAVAGSHGKTTTTSFLATALSALDFRPTYIVGGVVKNLGSNAGMGEGDYLVAEADESDGSFLYLNPIISIITNIDNDHLDYYKTVETLEMAFVDFANKIPFYGHLVLNGHDEKIGRNLQNIKRPYVTFGIKGRPIAVDSLDYMAENLRKDGEFLAFDVVKDKERATFKIKMHGDHNALNALGAAVVAHKLGASLEDAAKSLAKFEGVGRRLETLKDEGNLLVIDDYGHHPTEIEATLSAIEKRYSDRDIVVAFEPHRYTRTENFWNDFVQVLTRKFPVYILPIYPAGEKPVPYIDSEIMVKNVNENGGHGLYISSLKEIGLFNKSLKTKTLVLTLGAGSISRQIRELV